MPDLVSRLTVEMTERVSVSATKAAKSLYRLVDAQKDLSRYNGSGMKNMLSDFKKYENQLKRIIDLDVQHAIKQTSKTFEQQKSSILSTNRALKEYHASLNRLASQERTLQRNNQKADQVYAKRGNQSSTRNAQLGTNLGEQIGSQIIEAVKRSLETGANIEGEKSKGRRAGMSEAEIARVNLQAWSLQHKYPTVLMEDIHKIYGELRAAIPNKEDVLPLLDSTVQAKAAFDMDDASGSASGGLNFLMSAADLAKRTQDPQQYKAYLDAMVRSRQALGEKISAEEIYTMTGAMGNAAHHLSNRFLSTTALSLAKDLSASTAGESLAQFHGLIAGNLIGLDASARKEFISLGLADKKSGKVQGADLAQSDPDLWVNQYLLPAFAKKGLTDLSDQLAEIKRLFPSGPVADSMAKLVTQRQTYENYNRLTASAKGSAAATELGTDPLAATSAFTNSLQNLAGALTSPLMAPASKALSGLADGISSFSEGYAKFSQDHPDLAMATSAGALVGAVGVKSILQKGGIRLMGRIGFALLRRFPIIGISLFALDLCEALSKPFEKARNLNFSIEKTRSRLHWIRDNEGLFEDPNSDYFKNNFLSQRQELADIKKRLNDAKSNPDGNLLTEQEVSHAEKQLMALENNFKRYEERALAAGITLENHTIAQKKLRHNPVFFDDLLDNSIFDPSRVPQYRATGKEASPIMSHYGPLNWNNSVNNALTLQQIDEIATRINNQKFEITPTLNLEPVLKKLAWFKEHARNIFAEGATTYAGSDGLLHADTGGARGN